ncbi:MAG: glycosyl hydrolase 115 family protein [Nibricoccus sp.]
MISSILHGGSLGLSEDIVANDRSHGSFPLVANGKAAPVFVDSNDYPGVLRAATDVCSDVERVCDIKPVLSFDRPSQLEAIVIVGTLGRSALLNQLVKEGKLPAGDIEGKWESFIIATVSDPLPGIGKALVIAGSDKRGTIFGLYELSEQMGVSPWYWWADVAPKKRPEAFVNSGIYSSGEPVVRYRGIFLNNEAPCLTGWADEKFGGLNSKFYTKLFELLLRMRANYLWPAMWNNAFNEDDPDNPRLADEYGIVMGTSHHEPMMRAHKEWTKRRLEYGNGKWNYSTNAEAIQRFFREGISRNKNYENLVTIGMRGDGDEGMESTGSVESDIKLLQRIFSDQRRILTERDW